MRNLFVHQYFGVDPHEVWNAVISDLPTLKASIVKIIDEISPSR